MAPHAGARGFHPRISSQLVPQQIGAWTRPPSKTRSPVDQAGLRVGALISLGVARVVSITFGTGALGGERLVQVGVLARDLPPEPGRRLERVGARLVGELNLRDDEPL